ncbi:hypothetical protein SH467x_003515 [Pirellulaceae bacterium SH467]
MDQFVLIAPHSVPCDAFDLRRSLTSSSTQFLQLLAKLAVLGKKPLVVAFALADRSALLGRDLGGNCSGLGQCGVNIRK